MKRKRSHGAAQQAVKKQRLDDDSKQKPSHPLLRKYYAEVVTLREYLASRLTKKRRRRLQQYGRDGLKHDASVCQLLDETIIGTHAPIRVQDESIVVEEDLSIFTQQLSVADATSSLAPGSFKQSEVGVVFYLLEIHILSRLSCISGIPSNTI